MDDFDFFGVDDLLDQVCEEFVLGGLSAVLVNEEEELS